MNLADIDRLFFERLRLEVVAQGFLPDMVAYSTSEEYALAKQAIITSGNQLIEVYGVGAKVTRGQLDYNRMVVTRSGSDKGTLGGVIGGEVVEVPGSNPKEYQRVEYESFSKDLTYEIRTVVKNTAYDRMLNDLLFYSLRERSYHPVVLPDGSFDEENLVLVEFLGEASLNASEEYLERLYKFVVKDVMLSRAKVLNINIKPLTTVEYFVYLTDKDNPELTDKIV